MFLLLDVISSSSIFSLEVVKSSRINFSALKVFKFTVNVEVKLIHVSLCGEGEGVVQVNPLAW